MFGFTRSAQCDCPVEPVAWWHDPAAGWARAEAGQDRPADCDAWQLLCPQCGLVYADGYR